MATKTKVAARAVRGQDDSPFHRRAIDSVVSRRTWARPLGRQHQHQRCRCCTSSNSRNVKPARSRKGKNVRQELMKPEVLAPVGGWEQLKAAVAHGADAVYFGINDGFNARARAHNFHFHELEEVMAFLGEYGVKGFACLNVLVFEEEVERVTRSLLALERAGVDAVIVQDQGVMTLAKQVAPGLKIHASTQASVSSLQGSVYTARNLGAERVVVGRELSIKEIANIDQGLREMESCDGAEEPSSTHSSPSLEVFVHGALCVSYSGQCFSSEAWGGRSANRGQCAQACRMPYGLIKDGKLLDFLDQKYLLSPQDLSALHLVPQLMEAGVKSFKIEGRLKGPEYVGLATQMYRKAVDEAYENYLKEREETDGKEKKKDTVGVEDSLEESKAQLAQMFARGQDEKNDGLSAGFLEGTNHQKVVIGKSPRHRGVYVGKVVNIQKRQNKISIELPSEAEADAVVLKNGDGLVFDCGRPESEEAGGTILQAVHRRGQAAVVEVKFRTLKWNLVHVGDLVWRNKDPQLEKEIRSQVGLKLNERRKSQYRVPVKISCRGALGKPFELTIENATGISCSVSLASEKAIEPASKKPLTKESVARAIGKLGGTSLAVEGDIATELLKLEEGLFLPVHELKETRRRAVLEFEEKLDQQSVSNTNIESQPHIFSRNRGIEDDELSSEVAFAEQSEEVDLCGVQPHLTALCRHPDQVAPLLDIDSKILPEIILDFLSMNGLKDSIREVEAAGKRVIIALPRILKPKEEGMAASFYNLGENILVRNTGHIEELAKEGKHKLYGDFSLNVANSFSVARVLKDNLVRFAPSHDLNGNQISSLAMKVGEKDAGKMEVIIHHHLPIFHTEHCVFCRFLSDGSSKKDCGQPCEEHTVHLRDHLGKDHLVLADQGCRNTVFNAQAQSGAYFLPQFLDAGIKSFRIEFADEPKEVVAEIISVYNQLLQGDITPSEVFALLEKIPDSNGMAQGVTVGSFEVKREQSKASMKPTAR